MSKPVTMLFIGGCINGKAMSIPSPPLHEWRIPNQNELNLSYLHDPRARVPASIIAYAMDLYRLDSDILGNPAYRYVKTEKGA